MKDSIKNIYPTALAAYFRLHAHPELSFKEHQTAEWLSARLQEVGIDHRSIATTGILAKIEGRAEGADLSRAIVLRADIDALPIEEANSLPYASTERGVMHACGHDMHASVLLGALLWLHAHREELGVTIFGLFQPGEEVNPGGAKLVLEEAPFEGYDVVAVIGNHIEPTLPTGTIGIRAGQYMAACDELHFTLCGRGGHAALREKIIDPILPSTKLIEGLYHLPNSAPEWAGETIISIGKIEAAGATNVVPDAVHLEGTMRTFNGEWRKDLMERINNLCGELERDYGIRVENNFGCGYPAVYNTPALAEKAREVLSDKFEVVGLEMRPTGEDFGYYTERYPSLFYRLGVGFVGEDFEGGKAGRLHTATLAPDLNAIEVGIEAMTTLTLEFQHL